MLKKVFAAALLLGLLVFPAAHGEGRVETLTYAVFPYLPDAGRYQELIERRWAELEPDIRLQRARRSPPGSAAGGWKSAWR